MDLIDSTTTEVRDALAAGRVRCTDLVEQWIDRTRAARALNCYVNFDEVCLRRQAHAAQARLDAGERLPLLGVPVALKDNIQVAGLPCGDGTRALHGRVVANDAVLVSQLRAAGALITGTLGMHELAFGASSNNAVTGAVRNPWNTSRIPGGSSGGCGAAVAARLVPAAIGTDTGGSVRIPAALCGVSGFRPTVGRVSCEGLAPISATRDTPGPLAPSVADLALLDGVLANEAAPLEEVRLRGLKLGWPQDLFWSDLNADVERSARAALDVLRHAGVEFVPVALPGIEQLDADVSFVVALFEFVRDMTRYLAEAGRGVSFEELVRQVASPDVAAITGPLLNGGSVPDDAYAQALQARQRLQALYRDAFTTSGAQALVFPTTPALAAPIGEDETFMHNGRACPTFATFIRNTDPGSNAAIPGLSLPVGLANGLPVGLALDGPCGSDRRLLAIGQAVSAALPPMPLAPAHWH